jgi:hypothetical protein
VALQGTLEFKRTEAMASVGSAEDLATLDRLLTRLALTEDAQLEKVLSKLLPLALSRLGSSHAPTRSKVCRLPLLILALPLQSFAVVNQNVQQQLRNIAKELCM